MHAIAHVLIGTCLFVCVTVRAETQQPTGTLIGTGRGCYGTFDVDAKAITWMTPFSKCKAVPYKLIERDEQGDVSRMTFRLKPDAGTCRYSVLSLTHKGHVEHIGWDLTGYGSEQSYQADKARGYQTRTEDMMSCYLTRDSRK
jgi:hypothetical protein